MSCETVQRELVGFQLGEVAEATRGEIEAHLLECRGCLGQYLALKRDMETAASEPGPSEAARLSLRSAIAEELGLAAKPWRWWERPLALAFASTAVVLALFTVHVVRNREASPPHGLVARGEH
jgi:hypothetical protein